MAKKIIFQDTLLVSGIMCHQGCGITIFNALSNLATMKQQSLLPHDAKLFVDAEPQGLGIHRLAITIESEEELNQDKINNARIIKHLKETLDDVGFDIINAQEQLSNTKPSKKTERINILINLLAILGIIILSIAFPPSLPLTISLTFFSFLTTAFTARHYFLNFYRNLRNKNVATMATPITLGWFLSLGHTLFHSITMPLASSFSMTFMNFVMPIMLISIINSMDEVKRLVLNRSKEMQLMEMKAIFPRMAKAYDCYELSSETQHLITQLLTHSVEAGSLPPPRLDIHDGYKREKHTLEKGMIIKVSRGECFPVDGVIIQGDTLVDSSILTGEPRQSKKFLDAIPAGAINLRNDVIIYATENSYNSTVNKLLFRSNRSPQKNTAAISHHKFSYFYTALVLIGIAATIAAPFAFGILTIPLALQNITGILFAICPCTIAIAHQLPKLLSLYQRMNKGIILRNETFIDQSHNIHTVVFDKTGTLTTGNSEVDSHEGISPSLWQRVYLLEKSHGAGHPLAKAIETYYAKSKSQAIILRDISEAIIDVKHRGVSAMVQGKKIHVGNIEYLKEAGVSIPTEHSSFIAYKLSQGFTPVYVAEDSVYQGVIFIKHEIREGIMADLKRLKKEGKKIIMLTGDNQLSAQGFNQQYGSIFEPEDLHAGYTPTDKEAFLETLMNKSTNAKGVWFVGDGLNDAPCSRIVSDRGGVSASITSNDKAAFFTDISLNGSLRYLFVHQHLNHFLKKNITQNQWLLTYSALIFLAFIMSFSMVGIAVSPLIPVSVMVLTMLFSLFNAYRVQLAVDVALDKKPALIKQIFASDVSIGLLMSAVTLLVCGVLISTIATGGLALPALIFTAGIAAAVSSACTLAAGVLFGIFSFLGFSHLFAKRCQTASCLGEEESIRTIQPSFSQEGQEPNLGKGTQFFPVNKVRARDEADRSLSMTAFSGQLT